MKSKLAQPRHLYLPWFRFLILLVLIIGIFFRFYNLDKKIYWRDEAYTSLRISGYTKRELVRQVFDGHEIGIEDLHKYQRINSEKNAIDTVYGLAAEEPQLPPLYFVIARFWTQWFGNSVTAIRSLSAAISLFTFPCIYWLCRELFELPLTGWVAIALVAVSPFHVLYAQEARPYSLWTVTIFLSSAALLRAMRLQTKLSWTIYAASVALGFYTFLFSTFVAIGHGIYIFSIERFKFSKTAIAYLVASLAGFITVIPWLLIIITNLSQVENKIGWAFQQVSLFFLFIMWVGNISRVFFDFGISSDDSLIIALPLPIPILILLILVGYGILFIYQNSPKRVYLFVLTLMGTIEIALIVPDLIFGGQRSGIARYSIPFYVGIELALAYLLTSKISSFSVNYQRKKSWQVITLAVVSCGIFSCVLSSQAQVWWNKDSHHYPALARIINQASQPLLISDAEPEYVLPLSYILEPKVQLQLVVKPNLPKISKGFSDLFLYQPSQRLRLAIEEKYNYSVTPVRDIYQFQGKLWQLKK